MNEDEKAWDYDGWTTVRALDGYIVPQDPMDLLQCDGCQ